MLLGLVYLVVLNKRNLKAAFLSTGELERPSIGSLIARAGSALHLRSRGGSGYSDGDESADASPRCPVSEGSLGQVTRFLFFASKHEPSLD